MAVAFADLKFRFTVTSGSAGNTVAGGGAGTSLGKYISTTDITDNVANNLFTDETGDQNAASQVDYQAIAIWNNHGSLTAKSVVVYMSSEVASGTSFAIAVDSTAASAVGGASAQALTIASVTTAPAGPLTFTSPTTKGAAVAVGDIPAGQVRMIWIRRTAANTGAVDADGATFTIAFDTGA